MRTSVILTTVWLCCSGVPPAAAAVLYEDVFYWTPSGTMMNPANPPTNAYVKIQETVYDNVQGSLVLSNQITHHLIIGPAQPTAPINLYAYSITNLGYDDGPFTGSGAGVSGFNIPNLFNVPTLGLWAPVAANSAWEPAPGNSGPGNWEWDIDANQNGQDGDGIGILLGQTFDSLCFAVPAGTPHGFIDGAMVHTWSGGGALEQPVAAQTDLIFGRLSAPVPEPSTNVLVGLAIMALVASGWRGGTHR